MTLSSTIHIGTIAAGLTLSSLGASSLWAEQLPPAENEAPANPSPTVPANASTTPPSPVETVKAPVEPAYEVEHYRPIWERSPFTLSSASVAPTAGFASNLVLVAIVKIDDAEYIRVLDKVSKDRITITPDANSNGIQLVSISANNDPLKASVRVKKGSEEAVLRYDATLLKAARIAAVPAPRNGQRPPTKPPTASNTTGKTTPVQRRRRIVIPSRPPAKR